ncbi:hypothetical protein BDR26DRAFT_1011512 [Obelidium mucronatum]|nr:hypothetical protein BDR26DRAFT_1011512 [Obelidium mucronatum]
MQQSANHKAKLNVAISGAPRSDEIQTQQILRAIGASFAYGIDKSEQQSRPVTHLIVFPAGKDAAKSKLAKELGIPTVSGTWILELYKLFQGDTNSLTCQCVEMISNSKQFDFNDIIHTAPVDIPVKPVLSQSLDTTPTVSTKRHVATGITLSAAKDIITGIGTIKDAAKLIETEFQTQSTDFVSALHLVRCLNALHAVLVVKNELENLDLLPTLFSSKFTLFIDAVLQRLDSGDPLENVVGFVVPVVSAYLKSPSLAEFLLPESISLTSQGMFTPDEYLKDFNKVLDAWSQPIKLPQQMEIDPAPPALPFSNPPIEVMSLDSLAEPVPTKPFVYSPPQNRRLPLQDSKHQKRPLPYTRTSNQSETRSSGTSWRDKFPSQQDSSNSWKSSGASQRGSQERKYGDDKESYSSNWRRRDDGRK